MITTRSTTEAAVAEGERQGCSPHPTPSRPDKSRPCPTPPRQPAGRSGAKLTADSIDCPFSYAYKLCIRGGNSRKIFSFDYDTDCDYLVHRNTFLK